MKIESFEKAQSLQFDIHNLTCEIEAIETGKSPCSNEKPLRTHYVSDEMRDKIVSTVLRILKDEKKKLEQQFAKL